MSKDKPNPNSNPDDPNAPLVKSEEQIFNEEHTKKLQVVSDIPLSVTCVLGSSTMTVKQLLKLAKGSVVELNRNVGEPIDILVNGKLVAKGEIIIIEDRIGITLTDLIRETVGA